MHSLQFTLCMHVCTCVCVFICIEDRVWCYMFSLNIYHSFLFKTCYLTKSASQQLARYLVSMALCSPCLCHFYTDILMWMLRNQTQVFRLEKQEFYHWSHLPFNIHFFCFSWTYTLGFKTICTIRLIICDFWALRLTHNRYMKNCCFMSFVMFSFTKYPWNLSLSRHFSFHYLVYSYKVCHLAY